MVYHMRATIDQNSIFPKYGRFGITFVALGKNDDTYKMSISVLACTGELPPLNVPLSVLVCLPCHSVLQMM